MCFSLFSALVLKKFRTIVSEKLHSYPHVSEYPHRLLSFSDVLLKFYPRWIEFYRNIENIWKCALKWTRYLFSIFIVSFDSYKHVLTTSLEKRKTIFPRLNSWSSLCCHYGIINILLHHQTFLPRNSEISVRWFLLKSVLKQMWVQGWQGRRKQMGSISLRYQSSVKCNFRTALKSTFDYTEIVNEWKWKQGTMRHYVRFFSQL